MNTTGRPDEGVDDEERLRGSELQGPDRPEAVDHAAYLKKRNPDAELRLDAEKDDDLYTDGLDIQGDDSTLPGTRGGGSAGAKG